MPRPSGTCAMPSRAIDSGDRRAIGLPAKRMSPRVPTVPEIARSVVVLPAPLAPRMATAWPSPTLSETPCSALKRPYDASTSWSSRSAIVLHPEIRLDHRGIGPHLGGRPARDQPAEVEHVHGLRHVHDEVHVMLDEQHRE